MAVLFSIALTGKLSGGCVFVCLLFIWLTQMLILLPAHEGDQTSRALPKSVTPSNCLDFHITTRGVEFQEYVEPKELNSKPRLQEFFRILKTCHPPKAIAELYKTEFQQYTVGSGIFYKDDEDAKFNKALRTFYESTLCLSPDEMYEGTEQNTEHLIGAPLSKLIKACLKRKNVPKGCRIITHNQFMLLQKPLLFGRRNCQPDFVLHLYPEDNSMREKFLQSHIALVSGVGELP